VRLFLLAAGVLGLAAPLPAADPPAPKGEAKAYQVPYRLTDTKHVLVRVKMNGKGPFNFILDTGAPAVFIPNAVAKKIGLKLDGKGWGTFDTFELEGGVPVEKARCRVEDLFQLEGMNGMGLAGVELHGVIGYNVLAKFKITYDFTADKLPFVPLAFNPPDPKGIGGKGGQGGLETLGPLMKMMAGFMGIKPNFEVRSTGVLGVDLDERKGGVVVSAVVPDGPADKAGIKVGDRLKALRGTEVDDLTDVKKVLAKTVGGDKLKVEVVRGEEPRELSVTLGRGL
jgi:hypothetical protein